MSSRLELTDEEIQLLRDVENILSTGRVEEMVHHSFPERIGALADRFDPERRVRTRFGTVNR